MSECLHDDALLELAENDRSHPHLEDCATCRARHLNLARGLLWASRYEDPHQQATPSEAFNERVLKAAASSKMPGRLAKRNSNKRQTALLLCTAALLLLGAFSWTVTRGDAPQAAQQMETLQQEPKIARPKSKVAASAMQSTSLSKDENPGKSVAILKARPPKKGYAKPGRDKPKETSNKKKPNEGTTVKSNVRTLNEQPARTPQKKQLPLMDYEDELKEASKGPTRELSLSATALHHLAKRQRSQNDCRRAVASYRKLFQQHPNYNQRRLASLEVAQCYRRLGKVSEARAHLKTARTDPKLKARVDLELRKLQPLKR